MSFPTHGAGDYTGAWLTFGAGDDVQYPVMGAGNYLSFESQGYLAVVLASNLSGRYVSDPTWIGEEGGYVIRIHSPNGGFTRGPYRVKMVDVTGQAWPVDEAGCHSTDAGFGHVCAPRFANTILQFATPTLAEGLYHVRVYDVDDLETNLLLQFRAVPTPYSREVATLRRCFPTTVYNPYPEGEG